MDVVKTNVGYISGTVLGEPDKQVHVYRGIPYAAPPVGELRWKPPKPVVPWSGIRECTAFSAVAPQSMLPDGLRRTDDMPESEDCLYLNVLTPARAAFDRLPVMVQMHTAGLFAASGNDRFSNLLKLPLNGVILVNFNTRLGPLGCLAHPLLSRESPEGVSGNYLFLDIVAALKWVQTNISAFGGDPHNVTVFGNSGGSVKVVNLMASPLAKGLFHRAIGQSGAGRGTPLKELEARGERVFAELGVGKETDPLAAASGLPWKRMIEASMVVAGESKLNSASLWDSAVDGWFLTDTPASIFRAGKQNAVPFIMGANLGELTGPGTTGSSQLLPYYVNLFAAANRAGGKAYAYIFDHVPAGWKKDGVISFHGLERAYVFGHFDCEDDWLSTAHFNYAKTSGAKSADPGFTETDRRVSDVMMKMWTTFARTGDPSVKGLVDWPAYEEATDRYLYITESLEIKSGFSRIAQK